jgi:hypothetical protein
VESIANASRMEATDSAALGDCSMVFLRPIRLEVVR